MKITLEIPDELGSLDALFLCHCLVTRKDGRQVNDMANSLISFPIDGDNFRLGYFEEGDSFQIGDRGTAGNRRYRWTRLANTKEEAET